MKKIKIKLIRAYKYVTTDTGFTSLSDINKFVKSKEVSGCCEEIKGCRVFLLDGEVLVYHKSKKEVCKYCGREYLKNK